jgi:glycosyltransferase involved in cell wall biosynthesis
MTKQRVLLLTVGAPDPTQGGSGIFNYFFARRLLAFGFEVDAYYRADESFWQNHIDPQYLKQLNDKGLKSNLVVERKENALLSFGFTHLMEHHQLPVCREAVAKLKPTFKDYAAIVSLDMGWAIALGLVGVQNQHLCLVGDPVYNRLNYDVKLNLLSPKSWRRWLQIKSMGFAYPKIRAALGKHINLANFSPQHAREYESNGISCRGFTTFSPPVKVRSTFPPVQGKIVAVHVGSLQTSASRSMMSYWENELFPELAKLPFDLEIRFVGKTGRQMQSRWKNISIVFVGHVEELDEEFGKAHVFFSPMKYPIGTRTRIVTALAFGTPAIADPSAQGGLPQLEDGKNILYASTPEAIASAFTKIYQDNALLMQLSQNARLAWETHFNPDVNVDKIIRAIGLLK